jgi:hypothetical protein
MPVEKQGTCLGIVPRERKKEVKLTFGSAEVRC